MQLKPVRFRYYSGPFRKKSLKFLDVGCGDHSPTLTKKYFPRCEYHGIDRETYNNSEEDLKGIDKYYELDLVEDKLESIPSNYFDALNFSHVIEHLPNGLEVLDRLLSKVKVGGYVYIEFPGMRSLFLPRAEGTLNFCDDGTHVRVYTLQEIANVLLKHNFEVCKLGRRREPLRLLLSPLGILHSIYHRLRKGRLHSRGLWDLFGSAEYIFARKRG